MRFLSVSAERNLPEMISIQWELDATPAGTLIFIERSESPNGPFETISPIPVLGDAYIDRNVNFDSVERVYYYRIVVKDYAMQVVGLSEPFSHEPLTPSAYVGRMMTLEKRVFLERFGGKVCHLYIRKTHAKRCPICWDKLRAKVILEDCDACYGTGFENGGFYAPVRIMVQIEPMPVAPNADSTGKADLMTSSGWTIGYPRIKHGDMIVRANKPELRYRVENVSFSEEFDVRITQNFTLVRYPASAKLMKMLVPKHVESIEDVNVFQRNP